MPSTIRDLPATLDTQECMSDRFEKLADLFDQWGIEHFRPREVVKVNPDNWSGGAIALPPERKLTHIYCAIKFADALREGWGDPVIVSSGYRPPEYNRNLPDASDNSTHTKFRALDLKPKTYDPLREWFTAARCAMAQFRQWVGGQTSGFGWYKYQQEGDSHIHVDFGADHDELGRSGKHVEW